jgi:hypothetical protein
MQPSEAQQKVAENEPGHGNCERRRSIQTIEHQFAEVKARVSCLTGIPTVWYGIPMNAIYLRGEMKSSGWMIHRNHNRNTNTSAA